MLGYIKGRVLHSSDGTVLLENNGIGYEVLCSGAAYAKLVTDGQGEVYTYLQVRDDGISLFGFVSVEEKNMFLKCSTVSKPTTDVMLPLWMISKIRKRCSRMTAK